MVFATLYLIQRSHHDTDCIIMIERSRHDTDCKSQTEKWSDYLHKDLNRRSLSSLGLAVSHGLACHTQSANSTIKGPRTRSAAVRNWHDSALAPTKLNFRSKSRSRVSHSVCKFRVIQTIM